MRKFLLIITTIACFYSCKKDGKNSTTQNASLLIGRWKATGERVRASTVGGTQVLDTTINLLQTGNYWFETYNANGTAYVTVGAHDTTSYLGYEVNGSKLTVYDGGDKGDKSDPLYSTILQLTNTTFEQEAKYTDKPNSGFGLDENTTYNFTEDVTYARQ